MLLLIYSVVLGMIIAGAVQYAWLHVRRVRVRTALQTLASIVGQNLPLVDALHASAAGERGKLRRIYARLATQLAAGDDLSLAVRRVLPACPGEVVGALQAAERSGVLVASLQSLAAELNREQRNRGTNAPPLWYPLIPMLVAPLFLILFSILLAPKYAEIFADYGVALPSLTTWLIDLTGDIALDVLAMVVLFALVLLVFQVTVAQHFVMRLPDAGQFVFAGWDTLVWHLPGGRAAAQARAMAQQLPLLAAALNGGQDLAPAAVQAATIPVNYFARRQMRRWAADLSAGADPVRAARHHGLPRPVVQALAAAQQGGNLPLQLSYLAEYYARLRVHWRRVVTAAVTPVLVAASGVLVALIVLALFLPVVTLLRAMLATVY